MLAGRRRGPPAYMHLNCKYFLLRNPLLSHRQPSRFGALIHRSQPQTAGSGMTWTQNYAPLGNIFLSALVAAIPVVVLLGALAFFHVKAHVAAILGLLLALGIAVGVYGMPLGMAGATAAYGTAFGLLPIGWIILNAIFIYDITVKTGKFE